MGLILTITTTIIIVVFLDIARLLLLSIIDKYDKKEAFRKIGIYILFLIITVFAYAVSYRLCEEGLDGPIFQNKTLNGRIM